MEIDFSLLSDEILSGEVEVEEPEEPEEPSKPTSPTEEPKAPEEPKEPEGEEFDDSTPLTPRERALIDRLERVTEQGLSAPRAVGGESSGASFSPQERNFLDGVNDLDEVLSSPENLNKLLLMVYNTALQEASKLSAESVMRGLPSTISNYVTEHIAMKELVNKFYEDNPDLSGVKRTVAAVANEIAADHPDYTTEQIFAESAKKTREMLRIKAQAPQRKGGEAKPAFVKQRSSNGRVKGEELSGLQKEIADLLA